MIQLVCSTTIHISSCLGGIDNTRILCIRIKTENDMCYTKYCVRVSSSNVNTKLQETSSCPGDSVIALSSESGFLNVFS